MDFKVFCNNAILYELVGIVHREFLLKSQGGEDSLGIQWYPLSPKLAMWKIKKKMVNDEGEPLINIRYGKLEKALRQGRFANGKYQPGKGQSASVTSMSIDYSVDIDYADDVNSLRPFLPEEIDPWLDEAIELALPRIQRYAKTRGYL
jgi:hypothetical protein